MIAVSTIPQQQMIDMFGQENINKLAKFSAMRQRLVGDGQHVDLFYALVSHNMGITREQTDNLFASVDVYEKYFLVNDQELAAFEAGQECVE